MVARSSAGGVTLIAIALALLAGCNKPADPIVRAQAVKKDAPKAAVGPGIADVKAVVSLLRERGVEFEETALVRVTEKGALTRNAFGGMNFEFVRSPQG